MHDRVETTGLERLRFLAKQAVIGDVAGHDDDLFFDVAIELVAEMLAQRAEHGRVENLAAEAADATSPVAANQQIDALDFGMPSQEYREEDLAQKSGRAGQQDAAVFAAPARARGMSRRQLARCVCRCYSTSAITSGGRCR